MDIGGGSNELIIANKNQIFFKHSFPLGMSRLLEQFKLSNPITTQEVNQIESYLDKELRPLFEATAIHKPQVLVGSSGSFDTYRAILTNGNDRCIPPSQPIDMSLTTNLKGYKIISFVLSYSVPIDVKDWYIGNKDLVCDSSALSDSLKVIMMGDYNSLNKDRRVTITNILAITPKGEIIWLNDLSIKIKADCEKNKTNTPFKPKRNGNKKAT